MSKTNRYFKWFYQSWAMALAALVAAGCGLKSESVSQGIYSITIDAATSEKVTFGGTTFGPNGAVGTYEKVRGRALGRLDPNDPKNQVIADIALATRNPVTGMVEYS